MYRTTNFTTGLLATALGVAAIAFVASPAAALPNKNLPAQFHPSPVMPVNQPIKTKLPIVQLQPTKPLLPKIPVVQLPPPPVKIKMPIDDICPLNKFKCPPGPIPSPGNPGKPPGGGTVVIVTPPVEVPVAVPVGIPSRIGGGGMAYSGPARPQAAPQCSAAGTTPELAAGIDQLLPTAQLSEADKAQVTDLRQTIGVLAADGKIAAARDTEEVAMKILGYRKVSLSCGGFDWEQQVATTAAVQQK